MILTLCTACAAPLPEDDAVQCAACATRYCSDRCERYDRRRGHGKICAAIASGGGAEQYHADKKYEEAVADAVEVRGGHGRSDVLHLFGGRLGRGPRAHVCVPRCCGFARFVLGAAGEGFDRGGRGEGFGQRRVRCEVAAVGYVPPVRTRLPRRRVLRARMGVLEDVRGAAGGDEVLSLAMSLLANGLYDASQHEDALPVQEARLSMLRSALVTQKKQSRRAEQPRDDVC